jgi:hypothetical protein
MNKYTNNYGGIEEDLSLKALSVSFAVSLVIGIGQYFILMSLFL